MPVWLEIEKSNKFKSLNKKEPKKLYRMPSYMIIPLSDFIILKQGFHIVTHSFYALYLAVPFYCFHTSEIEVLHSFMTLDFVVTLVP